MSKVETTGVRRSRGITYPAPTPKARMSGWILAGVAASTAVAFILSTTWYIVFGAARAGMLGTGAAITSAAPPSWMVLLELLRTGVVAAAAALAVARLPVRTLVQAMQLALVAWVAFPAVLLTGSVLWDGTPVALAAIHGGDWLLKVVVVTLLAVVARRRAERGTPS